MTTRTKGNIAIVNRKLLPLPALGSMLISAIVLLGACGQATPTANPTPPPTTVAASPTTSGGTGTQSTPSSTATSAPAPTGTAAPTRSASTPTATGGRPAATATVANRPLPDYLDDRSSPDALLKSYFNAIGRKEYLRAYSYWSPNAEATQLPPYAEFVAEYEDTESVELLLGVIGGDAGAGQQYFSVPVLLTTRTTDGKTESLAGCFILNLAQPGAQGTPPFRPLAIIASELQPVSDEKTAGEALVGGCVGVGGHQTSPITPTPPADPEIIDASRYLDDRTNAIQVLRSFFNAINRKEYVRAYSYWEENAAAQQLPPFAEFAEGYANTELVQLTTGEVKSDAGAGQLNFAVPVTIQAETTDGATQTFVGCYQLHLSQPAIQGTPPFKPLGIRAASIEEVGGDADTQQLMDEACQ